MLCLYLMEMIDQNLGFDPNAPGVRKIYVKPYSERYAYEIDPYVYGEYAGSLRDLIMSQYQRVVKMVNSYKPNPKDITVSPFNMDRFSWSLEFKVNINDGYGCHAPVTFMESYAPKLLILTDKELNNRVVMALAEVINCYYNAYAENWLKEWRKQPRTGR